MSSTPNGAYRTAGGARKAALRHPDCHGLFVVYSSRFGFGWANFGSATYTELCAGHCDNEPAIICFTARKTSTRVAIPMVRP